MIQKFLNYLLAVQIDIRFTKVKIIGDELIVNVPANNTMKVISLFFWIPLFFLTSPLLGGVSLWYLLAWLLIAPVLIFMGVVMFTTSYSRVYNKRREEVDSKVNITWGKKSQVFPFNFPPKAVLFTSKYSPGSQGGGAIEYVVNVEGVPSSKYVIYDNYRRALEFAQLMGDFFKISIEDRVEEKHRK